MGIRHTFVSSKDQGSDPDKVSKDEWNADHAGDFVSPASGMGTVLIPGLAGSPDIIPASPSSYDDEFDASLTGWTTLGSLDTLNANTIPSHLYMVKNTTSNMTVEGIYKAIPTMPFTVTVKLTDYFHSSNYQSVGLFVAEASPGKLFVFGPVSHTGHNFWTCYAYQVWNSRTSRSATLNEADGPYRKPYVRLIVTSSTNITTQHSEDGLVWVTRHTSINPGFTVGNVGIYLTANEGTVRMELAVDWIRFT